MEGKLLDAGREATLLSSEGQAGHQCWPGQEEESPKEGATVLTDLNRQQTKTCKELLVEDNGGPDDIFYLICFYKVKECCIVTAILNLKAGDQDGTL